MWISKSDLSIAVPIAYVDWSVSGTAVQVSNVWKLSSSVDSPPAMTISTDNGPPSHGMPEWTALAAHE